MPAMTGSAGGSTDRSHAERDLKRATKKWRAAKKQERASREELAVLVRTLVVSGIMSENKIATMTDIPRMTIRKMLGKD